MPKIYFTLRIVTSYYAVMSKMKLEPFNGGIRVDTGAWKIEHTAQAGGAWTSVVSTRGQSGSSVASGPSGNLLRAPLTSAIVCLSSDGVRRDFKECSDTQARLHSDVAGPVTSVIAEGVFRSESGETIPVGYRRRTDYHDSGVIWSTLEIMSDCGVADVIELSAAQVLLRPGLTQCAVRLHPTQAGGPDLLGASAEFSLAPNATAFLSRFTPLQLLCADRGGEGIEFFPGSDLAAWDFVCKSDAGLGFYRVAQTSDGTRVELMPYCLTQRRIRTTVQGRLALKLGIALPIPASAAQRAPRFISPGSGAGWNSIDAFKAFAASGEKMLCFRDESQSSGGSGWRAGAYPPSAPADLEAMRAAIVAAHDCGLKIVARIGVRQLHPSVPEYARHGAEWLHMAAPSLGPIRSWHGNEETGVLMCLSSGWLEFIKRHVDAVLTGLPWDGVYLENATPCPCCHPGHGRPFHSDTEGLLNLVDWCRTRVGSGVVLTGPGPRTFTMDAALERS